MALFDLEHENRIFEEQGLEAYTQYHIDNEDVIMQPGGGFPLVKAILELNRVVETKWTSEVVIMSRNSAETGLRIFKSIEYHDLDISSVVLAGGAPITNYLSAFEVDLFLSRNGDDVRKAAEAGFASARLYPPPSDLSQPLDEIRIAFDGDAVIFSDESERIYQKEGLEAFLAHEKENAMKALPEGPFAKLLKTLSYLQKEVEDSPISIRIALVTARSTPAVERVIRTLHEWNVDIDEAFFMGGRPKEAVLRSFEPHIFFDDQPKYADPASEVVPTGKVPRRRHKSKK